jgi:hypothetical protein
MIDEPDLPAGHLQIPFSEETTMFKTISAALLAVSVIAAPAMAAGTGKIAQAPASKSVQAPVIKNAQTNNKQGKTSLLNANAKMHHHKHYRHHRHHTGVLKTHAKVTLKPAAKSHSKVSFKHVAPTAKRG